MILGCQSISKAFGTNVILEKVSFVLQEREKAALIGVNGAGKSTLLKIIMGELSADEGTVIPGKDCRIGYLAQQPDLTSSRTIYEEVLREKAHVLDLNHKIRALEQKISTLSGDALTAALQMYDRLNHEFEQADGYSYQSEVIGVLRGLGFSEEEFQKPVSTLSGGQKTRVFLGKLLLSKPDLILLDEPTNHLDLDSISWLEGYLSSYPGAVLIVSHDRYFLDRIVTKVIELERGKATVYEGNYTAYADKKAQRRVSLMRQYQNQQLEIKRQEDVIRKLRSFNREKSIRRAESREKMLDKMEVMERPVFDDDAIQVSFDPAMRSGNDVLTVTDLAKSYGNHSLFSHLDFTVKRGERVAIIGKNGTGKTTILRILLGQTDADAGEIRLGTRVKIAYYDQEHAQLSPEKTLFEEISDADPKLENTQIRNLLASFLFTGEDVYKQIRDLSGGEQGRIALAKLMLSSSNFLLLDEPTNHLDITSREVLEDALCRYTGTVLYVSHDRYFINRTATRILDLTHGRLLSYLGDYDYYLEKKDEQELLAFGEEKKEVSQNNSAAKQDWQRKKEAQSSVRRQKNQLEKVQNEIEELETRSAAIEKELTLEEVFTDPQRLLPLQEEMADLSARLENLYETWESLALALEEQDLSSDAKS